MTAANGPVIQTASASPPTWRAQALLWLAALLLLVAGLASGLSQPRAHPAPAGGAALERAAVDLAILRQSEAPSLTRRGTADERVGGPDDASTGPAPHRPCESATKSLAQSVSSPARHHAGARLRPEARAPPGA